jgi:acyloxyacyl hydrolase
MSKAIIGWICLLLVVLVPVINGGLTTGLESGANGGTDCAVCSILLGLVDHLTIVYNESAAHSLERLCSFLPDKYKTFCKAAVDFLGKYMLFIQLIGIKNMNI